MTRLLSQTSSIGAMGLLAIAMVAGCSTSHVDKNVTFTAAEVNDLQATVERIPGPTKITATVASGINDYGSISVDAYVPADTSPAAVEQIVDGMEKAVWTSRLPDVTLFTVSVRQTSSRELLGGHSRNPNDAPELRAKYGPRPNGGTP